MSLIGRVLLDVALLTLLVRILHALLAARRVICGHLLAIAGSFAALVLGRNRRHLAGHDAVSRQVSICDMDGAELIAPSDVLMTTTPTARRS
jgi:hypothetical protein